MVETSRATGGGAATQFGSPSSSSAGGWASGSFAVVIAVNGVSSHRAEPAPVWNLKGLRRGGAGADNRLSTPNVVAWNPIGDARIKKTQVGAAYQLRQGAPIPKPARESAEQKQARLAAVPASAQDPDRADWWTVSAIELFTFDTAHDRAAAEQPDSGAADDPVTYVVLHVIAKTAALRAITEAVSYFSSPYAGTDQSRLRWPVQHLKTLLRDLGFATGVEWARPFVITHLVPDGTGPHGALPTAEAELLGARDRGWTDEQIWAWRLAAGPNLTIDAEPGWDPQAPTRGGFWSGSTWCRVDHLGAAFVGTRALDELPTASPDEGQVWWRDAGADVRRRQYIEHVRLEAFTHRHAVDLTILAMRQTRYLTAHATILARTLALPVRTPASPLTSAAVGGTTTEVSANEQRYRQMEAARKKALAMELSLIEFRNDLWFAHVPGDPDVSATMAALHQALGSNTLLADIDDEQQDITRVLGLASQEAAAGLAEAQRAAALAVQSTAAQTARNLRATEKILKARRETLDKLITFAAPVIAVPGVVFAFVQVYQGAEGGRDELWWGVAAIGGLCLVAWTVLYLLLVRTPARTSSNTEEGDQPGAPPGGVDDDGASSS